MKEFIKALCAESKNSSIPEDRNLFGPMIGEWDIEWADHLENIPERCVKGEWIFSWVLEGCAVQDVFIVPSRAERLTNHQPDAEYGTTIRIYNPQTSSWDIFFGCPGSAVRLTARKEGNEIVLTELEEQKMKWIFSDITPLSFRWRKMGMDNSGNWKTDAKVSAKRKTESSDR